MVFGQPVYNTEQRRAILQQYKNYIDDLREKKALSSWDKATKTKRRIKRDKTLSKNNRKRRKRRRRRKKSKITLAKLRNLLGNDRYIK